MPTYKVKPEQDYPIDGRAFGKGEKNKKRYPTSPSRSRRRSSRRSRWAVDVEVTLKGKVRGLESRQSTDNDPYNNRNELRVELRVVEAYPTRRGRRGREEKPSRR
jgi:hypothetical protein